MAWGATVIGEGFYPLVTKREASGARLLGEPAKRNSDGGYASEPDADCLSAADSLSQDQRGEEDCGDWCDRGEDGGNRHATLLRRQEEEEITKRISTPRRGERSKEGEASAQVHWDHTSANRFSTWWLLANKS
jgi:hypothetical protein